MSPCVGSSRICPSSLRSTIADSPVRRPSTSPKLLQPRLDPLHRRRLEDLLAAPPSPSSSSLKRLDPAFGLDERLGQCLAARPSPMKSTKLASRRSSAVSSVSLSRIVSGTWA